MSIHVIVAGGGIGGLALAQGLRKAGVSVAVYERDRHRTDRLQGFRIHLSPHGSRALHELLPPELFDALMATSGKGGNEYSFLSDQGAELLHLGEDITTGGERDRSESHYGVSRITLRQILLTGLDDVVHFDKRFERYERGADGRITAHFADGTTATGDVLVGADGGNSLVRKQYLPHAERVDTGIVTIVGKRMLTGDGDAVRFRRGPASVIGPAGRGMFVAPHEFERAGRNDTALEPGALFDNTRPYVFWAYAAKRSDYPVDPPLESLDATALHALAMQLTDTWAQPLRQLIAETDPSTVTLIQIGTSVPVDPWPASTVTLLGDAIHSMTPFRGIGANTALRDAQALCRHLVAADHGEEPVVAGIEAYEEAMRDYGFEAVRNSLKAAHQATADGRVARIMGKTVFRAMNAIPAIKRMAFAGFGDG